MKISTCQKACVVCTKYRYIYINFFERDKSSLFILKLHKQSQGTFLALTTEATLVSQSVRKTVKEKVGETGSLLINIIQDWCCPALWSINHLNLSIHINYFGKNITLQAHHHIWENLAGSTAHCIFFRCFIWRTRNQSNDSKTGSTSGQVFNNLMFLLKTTTKHSLLLKCSFFFIEYSLYHGHWVSNHPLLSEAAASVIANTLRSSQLSNNTVTLTL